MCKRSASLPCQNRTPFLGDFRSCNRGLGEFGDHRCAKVEQSWSTYDVILVVKKRIGDIRCKIPLALRYMWWQNLRCITLKWHKDQVMMAGMQPQNIPFTRRIRDAHLPHSERRAVSRRSHWWHAPWLTSTPATRRGNQQLNQQPATLIIWPNYFASPWPECTAYMYIYIMFSMSRYQHTWVFPKIGVSQNEWFIMENPIKIDDLGVPLFSENIYIQ